VPRYNKLLAASDRYTRLQLLHTDGLKRAEQEHAQIVELCRKRRFRAAADLLRSHIQVVKASLLDLVARRG
jgi:DNA-binding GntR family transcriptional regulator